MEAVAVPIFLLVKFGLATASLVATKQRGGNLISKTGWDEGI